jgi:lipopolysaccharide transport system permease protein
MTMKLYWSQIKDLTIASIKARYRKTWAGFLWVILNPILMFGVQSLVFKKFLRLEMPNYYLFLLGGLLPWIFFSSTVQMGTPLFVSQSHLLRSFKINPLIILASQVLDNFINFIASFIIILVPFLISAEKSFPPLILLPLALFPLLMGAVFSTMILSTMNVFFRDINFIIGFIFSLLFFLTPIFYPIEYVPEEYRPLIMANPIIHFIDPFRSLIYDKNLMGFFPKLGKSLFFASALGVLAVWIWKRKINDFYHKL